MNKIKWISRTPPIDPSVVEGFASDLMLTFPSGFIEIASKFPYAHPNKECFDIKNRQEVVLNRFLKFDRESPSSIYSDYESLSKNLEETRILPFADDPFGNLICFDFRKTDANPPIVFWDHEADVDAGEESLHFVANSFDEFLDMLYEPED